MIWRTGIIPVQSEARAAQRGHRIGRVRRVHIRPLLDHNLGLPLVGQLLRLYLIGRCAVRRSDMVDGRIQDIAIDG